MPTVCGVTLKRWATAVLVKPSAPAGIGPYDLMTRRRSRRRTSTRICTRRMQTAERRCIRCRGRYCRCRDCAGFAGTWGGVGRSRAQLGELRGRLMRVLGAYLTDRRSGLDQMDQIDGRLWRRSVDSRVGPPPGFVRR